jgi:FlaA1/EpsC-like NDP-sugar epimerase
MNIAKAMVEDRNVKIEVTGIRPGEKTHEIMVSDVEAPYAVQRGRWYGIRSMLPEVRGEGDWEPALTGEYSSGQEILSLEETAALLKKMRLMPGDQNPSGTELLR